MFILFDRATARTVQETICFLDLVRRDKAVSAEGIFRIYIGGQDMTDSTFLISFFIFILVVIIIAVIVVAASVSGAVAAIVQKKGDEGDDTEA